MEKEIPLYKTIYLKIVDRILVGTYPKGYQLASSQKINSQYNVGYTSIRRALRLLEEDGFIALEERKRPTVIFDPELPACHDFRWRFFLQRCNAHLDCYHAMPYVIPGIAVEGARKRSPALLGELAALVTENPATITSRDGLLRHLHKYVRQLIHSTGNGLAEDLFYQSQGFDMLRKMVLPSQPIMPGEAEGLLNFLGHLNRLIENEKYEELHTLLFLCYQQAYFELMRLYSPLPYQDEAWVVFLWNVHQTATPLYQRIAYDLLRTAQMEGLAPGDYFPSEAALTQRYDVAPITVRGALALLGSLGFAQAVNGVGTRFISEYQFSPQRDAYLKEYFEALELLSSCSRSLALNACDAFSPQEIAALKEDAAFYRTRNGLLAWLIASFVATVSSHALHNILQQLESRLIFGIFINDLRHSSQQQAHQEWMYQRAVQCLEQLEHKNIEAFTAQFSELFDTTYRSSQTRLAALLGQNPL